jgi:hypothetical protein
MASTSSHTCFFSFGPDDSFISKSYEGLRYHGLPPALRTLIAGGTVRDVHWVRNIEARHGCMGNWSAFDNVYSKCIRVYLALTVVPRNGSTVRSNAQPESPINTHTH